MLLTVAFFEEAVVDIVGASVDGFSVEVAFEPEVVLLTVAFFEEAVIDIVGASVDDFSVEVTVDGSCDAFSSFIEVDISGTGSVFAIVCSSVEVPNNKSIFYY